MIKFLGNQKLAETLLYTRIQYYHYSKNNIHLDFNKETVSFCNFDVMESHYIFELILKNEIFNIDTFSYGQYIFTKNMTNGNTLILTAYVYESIDSFINVIIIYPPIGRRDGINQYKNVICSKQMIEELNMLWRLPCISLVTEHTYNNLDI